MTGWDREYLANKNEYLKLFDNVMQKENERNVEFLEKRIAKTIGRKFAEQNLDMFIDVLNNDIYE